MEARNFQKLTSQRVNRAKRFDKKVSCRSISAKNSEGKSATKHNVRRKIKEISFDRGATYCGQDSKPSLKLS
jgi:hypothetical protein